MLRNTPSKTTEFEQALSQCGETWHHQISGPGSGMADSGAIFASIAEVGAAKFARLPPFLGIDLVAYQQTTHHTT